MPHVDEFGIDCYVDAEFAGLWGFEDPQDPTSVKSRTIDFSSEMWDYSNPYEFDGDRKEESTCELELFFDKFVPFMLKLLRKLKALEVIYSLTVVFFSRSVPGCQSKRQTSCIGWSFIVVRGLWTAL